MEFLSLFLILIFNSFNLSVASSKPFQLCYFSLNEKTQDLSEKFTQSGLDNTNIEIIEYYHPQSKSSTSKQFKKMVEAGNCDGLVFSGHHTGTWFGQKSKSRLTLDFIEKMSCRYPDWFKNVKALWLHGCNTVTDNFITPTKITDTPFVIKTADSETVRFIDTFDSRESQIKTLNYAYNDTLNEYTPLSSRYLRAFPNVQIYGFSNTSPTEEQIAESDLNDIFNHISAIGNSVVEQEAQFQSDVDQKEIIQAGLDAISNNFCSDKRLMAWEEMNKDTQRRAIKNQDHEEARILGCDLIQAKQALKTALNKGNKQDIKNRKNEITSILKKIIDQSDNSILIHHLLNNIFEIYQTAEKDQKNSELKNKNSSFFYQIKNILKDPGFQKTLKEQISSPINSSFKKIDYLKLYEKLNGQTAFVKKAVSQHIQQIQSAYSSLKNSRTLFKTGELKGFTEQGRAIFSRAVIEQLRQYNLLSQDDINSLLKNTLLFPDDNSLKNQGNLTKYKLQYSSYLLNKNNSDFIHNFKSTASQNSLFAPTVTKEILKKEDIETFKQFFSDSQDTSSWTKVETGMLKGTINHLFFMKPKKQLLLLNKYMASSKNHIRLQKAFVYSAYHLKNKEFLQDIPKNSKLKKLATAFLERLK